MALLTGTLTYNDLKSCDLIIEAVFEELGVKEAVFKKLDGVAKTGAILATNTSTLDVNRIARSTSRPADVVGMHFFSPANVMKLLEVVRGAATAKDVLATVMQLAKKLSKTAVVSGVCDGFIGNRMIGKYGHEAGVLMVTGHAKPGDPGTDWRALAHTARQAKLTLVVSMGVAAAQRIQDELLHGLPADTPVAIVQDATLPSQRQALCTLDCLHQTLTEQRMASPCVLLIGDVLRVLDHLGRTHDLQSALG
jgi:3-hydroxyacyl-CoA dehydrogenase